MRVSIFENIFDNVFRRSPKASSGVQMHLYNNLIRNWGRRGTPCTGHLEGTAASSTGGAQLLAQANVFAPYAEPTACRLAIQAAEKIPREGVRREKGMVREHGNLLLNGARVESNDPDRVFDPTSPEFSFLSPGKLLNADKVGLVVRNVAGPLRDER
jgi:pectate lyase